MAFLDKKRMTRRAAIRAAVTAAAVGGVIAVATVSTGIAGAATTQTDNSSSDSGNGGDSSTTTSTTRSSTTTTTTTTTPTTVTSGGSKAFRPGSATGAGGNGQVLSLTSPANQSVQIGDYIVVFIAEGGATYAVSSVTDSIGTPYRLIVQGGSPGAATTPCDLYIGIAPQSTTSNSITVTFNAKNKSSFCAGAYSGVTSIGAHAGFTTGNSGNDKATSGTMTLPLSADSWIVGGELLVANTHTEPVQEVTTGILRIQTNSSNSAHNRSSSLIDNTTGTISVTWPILGNVQWAGAVAELI